MSIDEKAFEIACSRTGRVEANHRVLIEAYEAAKLTHQPEEPRAENASAAQENGAGRTKTHQPDELPEREEVRFESVWTAEELLRQAHLILTKGPGKNDTLSIKLANRINKQLTLPKRESQPDECRTAFEHNRIVRGSPLSAYWCDGTYPGYTLPEKNEEFKYFKNGWEARSLVREVSDCMARMRTVLANCEGDYESALRAVNVLGADGLLIPSESGAAARIMREQRKKSLEHRLRQIDDVLSEIEDREGM